MSVARRIGVATFGIGIWNRRWNQRHAGNRSGPNRSWPGRCRFRAIARIGCRAGSPQTAYRHRSPRTRSGRSAKRFPAPREHRNSFRRNKRQPSHRFAAAAPPTLDQVIRYTLFNKAPIANPVQLSVNSQTRVVTGELRASDPDGGAVTYSVTRAPVNGTVDITQSGAYTFTPNTELADNGGTDEFRVTIADANVYRLAGVLRNDPGCCTPLPRVWGSVVRTRPRSR